MTIEATATLPAGWYGDPAQSGGERWWDGTTWTEHLRAPEPAAAATPTPVAAPLPVAVAEPAFAPQPYPTMPPPTGPVAPVDVVSAPTFAPPVITAPVFPAPPVQQAPLPPAPLPPAPVPPAPVQPAPLPPAPVQAAPAAAPAAFVPLAPLSTGPVALAPVGAPPVVPTYDTVDLHADSVRMHYETEVSNGSALLALLFGAISAGLAAIGQGILPYQQIFVSLAAVVALIFGVRGLARYRRREASIRWAPTVGIILGIIATVTVFFGQAALGFVTAALPQPPAQTSSSTAPISEVSPVPLVFPLNAALTNQEKTTQSIATAINRVFAGGAATLPAGKAWPASLKVAGTVVVAPNGAHLATLSKGESMTYTLSSDGKNYSLTVVGANAAQVATYGTSNNSFSYTCTSGDSTCTPSN